MNLSSIISFFRPKKTAVIRDPVIIKMISNIRAEQVRLAASPYNVADLCAIAGEKKPTEWPTAIVQPYNRAGNSIFGHQLVPVARDIEMGIIDALIYTLLCESKGEAHRAFKANGIRLNGVKASDPKQVLSAADAIPHLDAIVLEFGRGNYGVIELCD